MLRVARGAPPRQEVQPVLSRILLEGADSRVVDRRHRDDVHHSLRVARARARETGDSHPYHSYCFGEALKIDQARNG